jgi:hypothetical protein
MTGISALMASYGTSLPTLVYDLDAANYSAVPWEFDIGWMYIKGLEFLGLAKLKG